MFNANVALGGYGFTASSDTKLKRPVRKILKVNFSNTITTFSCINVA